ncbi:zeta toxin family protein [Streptomyces sp. 900105245]
MTEERSSRLLSDGELRELLDVDVRPLLEGSARERPRVVILGGTQGSGKSSALPLIAEQLGMADAVRVEGDDLLSLIPQFEPIAREHGVMEAFNRVGDDLSELMRMTLAETRRLRRDAILVGPYTAVEPTFQRLAEFTSAGYSAEAAYMAVHPARAQLGVLHRHHVAMRDGIGYSHAIPLELQERVYRNTPLIMAQAQAESRVEALHIADRQGIALTTRLQPDGTWTPPVDLPQAVQAHRMRPWDVETRADFTRRREEIRPTLTGAEWAERVASIDRLAAPMLTGPTPRPSAAAARSRSTDPSRAQRKPPAAPPHPSPHRTHGPESSPGRTR